MSERIEMVARQNVLGKDVMVYGSAVNPLFLAKDVAEWIDHKDVSMMLKSVDEEEKLIQALFVSGQNRDCWFLTEDGLYEVLMQSRKPIAKQFKKEVKHILHELRVNGTVVSARVAMASPEEQAVSFQQALESAMQHAFLIADSHYLPQIESLRREKAWIADRQTATAMQTASAKARRVNKLETEKALLIDRIDEIEEELDEEHYDAERYRSWRSKVGRHPKGYRRPDDRLDLF